MSLNSIRIVKQKRFIKPYEIELRINHSKYTNMQNTQYSSEKLRRFWSVDRALQFAKRYFAFEIFEGTQLITKVYNYGRKERE